MNTFRAVQLDAEDICLVSGTQLPASSSLKIIGLTCLPFSVLAYAFLPCVVVAGTLCLMNLLYVRAEIMSLMKQEVKKDLREMERDLVFARRPVPRYVCWLASEAFLLFFF